MRESLERVRVLEIATLIGAIGLLTVIGIFSTFALYEVDISPDPQAPVIRVIAKQFSWSFVNPDGSTSAGELRIKAGETYRLEFVSEGPPDPPVIHSFFVRDLGWKVDVVPGRVNTLWIRVDEPGEFVIQCAELCGTGHYAMRGKLVVV